MLLLANASVWRRKAILQRHMPNKTLGWHYEVGIVPLPAFTQWGQSQPFINGPFGKSMCPAVSLKVLVQIPFSTVKWIQILNDPNDAFQIVSSCIIFRRKRGLGYVLSTWLATHRDKLRSRTVCTGLFDFIVTFCFLI